MTAKVCKDAVYSTFCAFPAKVVSSSLAFMAGHAVRMINHSADLTTRVSQDLLSVIDQLKDARGHIATLQGKIAQAAKLSSEMTPQQLAVIDLTAEAIVKSTNSTAKTVSELLSTNQNTLVSLKDSLPLVPGAIEWVSKLLETACKANLLLLGVTTCTDSTIDFANEILRQKKKHFSWPVVDLVKFGVALAVCTVAENFFPLSGIVASTGMTWYTVARAIELIGYAAFDRSRLEAGHVRGTGGSITYGQDEGDQPGAPRGGGSALGERPAQASTGSCGGGEREGETPLGSVARPPAQAPQQLYVPVDGFTPSPVVGQPLQLAPVAAARPPQAAALLAAGQLAKAAPPAKAGAPAAAGAGAKKPGGQGQAAAKPGSTAAVPAGKSVPAAAGAAKPAPAAAAAK